MQRVELKEGVFWVGAVDWSVRDFHGYVTPRGSTYNNYLIMDDDVTLIDTVMLEMVDISIERIKRYTEMASIRNIVVNHIEPDHAGGLAEVLSLCPKATIYCTEKARKGLKRFFDISSWDIKTVKSGDTLNIGKRTLTFLETPMIHWPDSMMTYCGEDKILFSQDGFGQHLASAQRFDDEFTKCASWAELEDSVWDYYANILMPLGTLIKRKINEVKEMGIEIDIIAPDHGVIWRGEPGWVMQRYLDMADGLAEESAVIIYDTMWHGTEKMTHAIFEGLTAEGMPTKVIKLRATPASVAIKEFAKARGALIGVPTINNTMFPQIAQFMYYLKGLRPKHRIVSAFGAYGWGGGGVKEVLELTRKMGLEVVDPGYEVNYRPSHANEEECFEFGRSFAKSIREYHKNFKQLGAGGPYH